MSQMKSRRNVNGPSHRHAAPCGPWPWVDLDDDVQQSSPQAPAKRHQCPHEEGQCIGCWELYPQSLYPNWTPDQVAKSRMKSITPVSHGCKIHRVEVLHGGKFKDPGSQEVKGDDEFWKVLQESKRTSDVRLRVLFVENLSVPVLQMLGTKYNIEPFFWTSSVNWIPSRSQEDLRPRQGDHLTITFSFPRVVERTAPYHSPPSGDALTINSASSTPESLANEVSDTQGPLPLRSVGDGTKNYAIIIDHLAIHMVRDINTSTILSYQPIFDDTTTSASGLHARVFLAGQSVYWNKIFSRSSDPTFVLLTMLWYALYAWDQALEMLSEHIIELELHVISKTDVQFTQELHRIRANLLNYSFFLEDFRKSVIFVRETPNPAMESELYASDYEFSKASLEKECEQLLIQIKRLNNNRMMWDKRLQNVMQLAFSMVNIRDSKYMQRLTEASARDSTAMKQIAYLTMVFLPANVVSNAFSMNIIELVPGTNGTLAQYFALTIPLTIVTMWAVIAMHGKWSERDGDGNERGVGWLVRMSWPVIYVRRWIAARKKVRHHIPKLN